MERSTSATVSATCVNPRSLVAPPRSALIGPSVRGRSWRRGPTLTTRRKSAARRSRAEETGATIRVGELRVVPHDPLEQLTGSRDLATPLVQVGQCIGTTEVVLLRPLRQLPSLLEEID